MRCVRCSSDQSSSRAFKGFYYRASNICENFLGDVTYIYLFTLFTSLGLLPLSGCFELKGQIVGLFPVLFTIRVCSHHLRCTLPSTLDLHYFRRLVVLVVPLTSSFRFLSNQIRSLVHMSILISAVPCLSVLLLIQGIAFIIITGAGETALQSLPLTVLEHLP